MRSIYFSLYCGIKYKYKLIISPLGGITRFINKQYYLLPYTLPYILGSNNIPPLSLILRLMEDISIYASITVCDVSLNNRIFHCLIHIAEIIIFVLMRDTSLDIVHHVLFFILPQFTQNMSKTILRTNANDINVIYIYIYSEPNNIKTKQCNSDNITKNILPQA